MRVLIREVRRTGAQGLEHADSIFDGDVISVGRATDQIIQLADRGLPLAHSELRDAGRAIQIKAVGDDHFFVNGSRTAGARLDVDDMIEIGDYVMVLRPAPEGFDYALDFEKARDSATEVEFGSEFVQSLEGTHLSRRSWSWVLFVGLILGALMVPAAGLLDRDLGIALRQLPLPDDGLWLSGPLHESHSFMGEDCTACHVDAFARIEDEQCVACHNSVTHHVDTSRWQVAELEQQRCADCHAEHNEPTVLTQRDQRLCGDCHGNLEQATGQRSDLLDASDFEALHPEFRLSMLRPQGSGADTSWTVERVTLDTPGLRETSNLIFPHDVHMNAQGIAGPAGDVAMQCADCHRPELGGAYMAPIAMERHCADCHLLTFDDDDLGRELPHGEPDMIVRLLEEYYAREALFGATAAAGRPARAARRPGREPPMLARERNAGMEQARRQAFITAEAIFERTTCKTCHEVTRNDAVEGGSPWQVNPVRVAALWMPKGWFSHQAHVAEDCARCHASEVSSAASDVSMPSVNSCRDCHGGGDATNKLASECVDCHVFHLPGLDLMRPEVRGARLLDARSDLDVMRDQGRDQAREQLTPPRPRQ